MKKLGCLLLTAFFVACSTTPPQVPKAIIQKATDQDIREYREAEAAYRSHKSALALKRFATYIQKHPRTDITDRACLYAGQLYYDEGDYFRAARFWLYIVDGLNSTNFSDRALINAATAQYQMARYADATNTLNRLQLTETTDPTLASKALDLKAKLDLQQGRALEAAQAILTAANYKKNNSDKISGETRVTDMINGSFTDRQLEQALSLPEFTSFELPLRYRFGQVLYDQKSFGAAKDQFNIVLSKFPNTEQAKSAQEYVSSLDAQEKTDPSVIGVILPLTGKYGQMGYKTLRGIQMGLGFFNRSGGAGLKLAIIDSEGNADIARRGVERLVSEDHAIVIIGDMLSKTATAVASKAQELGVPCLVLAQKQDLSDIGDFIFRNTLTPEMQMRALVEVAMKVRGYKKFAILYPNDSYGTGYASLFWDNVLMQGGEITAAQSYQPEETDFRDSVQRLIGTYYAEEDRGKELQMRTAAWVKEQTAANAPKSQRDKPPKDLLPPVVDFDALFIPDSPKAIGQIAPMLAYNDVESIPLLGTNLWDTPQIITRGNKFVQNALFVDDFFTEDPSPSMKRFSSDFQAAFNYAPDVFEAQGYDSALLISQILKDSGSGLTRSLLKDKLAKAYTPSGTTGPLRMGPQREVEKSLVPLTIQGDKIVKFETGGALQ